MRASQVPGKPECLCDFILNLEDGAQFTIPQMQKVCKVSWHTCNNFINRFDGRFKPRRVKRSDGLGKPYIYQLPMGHKLKSPVDIDHPEKYTESKEYIDSDSKKVKVLKILFPNGIKPKEYSNFVAAVELLIGLNDLVWDIDME